MATLIKTVRCKLQVGQEETSILLETMSRFASACPVSISLDQRTFRWIPGKESVSVSTHVGRLVLPVQIGNYQRHLLAGQNPTSATLVYSRQKNEFCINIVLSTPVPDPKGERPVGVDRGLKNIAVGLKIFENFYYCRCPGGL